ncbi:DUF3011 domain-containing protein [Tunturiibacter lichenicola]|uniref:DUF3011 domain-containing protein n=1 Tax=Tunturiibacter lichenicola TaxID=2051959 RepID=UPI003D9B088E
MIISRVVSALLIVLLTTFTMAQTGGLTCSSDDGDYHYCRADTQNQVQLVRQISGSRCEQGYSWGFDPRGIWVDRGCRAQFSYGPVANTHTSSGNNNSNTGAVIAGGILGALILGSAVAAANNNSNNNDDSQYDHDRVNYYNDGYRIGRQDADNGRPNYPLYWSGRRPTKYSNDFDAGYVDGYNGFGRHPPR